MTVKELVALAGKHHALTPPQNHGLHFTVPQFVSFCTELCAKVKSAMLDEGTYLYLYSIRESEIRKLEREKCAQFYLKMAKACYTNEEMANWIRNLEV